MTEQTRPLPDDFFKDWKQREALAESMIPVIGTLYPERNVSTYMSALPMVNKSLIDLLTSPPFVRQVAMH